MVKDVNATEFKQIMQNKQVIILDVRTKDEYENGHIKDAINIDFYSPFFENQIKKLPLNKIYLIYCHSGRRSLEAANLMDSLGFRQIYNLSNGIISWPYDLIK